MCLHPGVKGKKRMPMVTSLKVQIASMAEEKHSACLLIISKTRQPANLRKLRHNYKSLSRGRCSIIFSQVDFIRNEVTHTQK